MRGEIRDEKGNMDGKGGRWKKEKPLRRETVRMGVRIDRKMEGDDRKGER